MQSYRCVLRCLMLWSLTLSVASASEDASNLLVSERVQPYPIDADNWSQLVAEIDSQRPISRDGRPSHGLTRIRLGLRYELIASGAECRLDAPVVTVDIDLRLPDWQQASRAPSAQRQRWDALRQALQLHEEGHRDIALRAARRLATALRLLPSRGECEDLSRALGTAQQRQLTWLALRNQLYDQRTRHGQLHSAVDPAPTARNRSDCLRAAGWPRRCVRTSGSPVTAMPVGTRSIGAR